MREDFPASIELFGEDVEVPAFLNHEKTINWISKLCGHYEKSVKSLNFIFCSDEHLLAINKEYLNHDYYTDIITFPYNESDELEADIFISIDRVKENAEEFCETYETEMIRVMAHGVLHLIGYSDKSEEEAQNMRQAENEAINFFEL
jgi:probable rRNA maturation factor